MKACFWTTFGGRLGEAFEGALAHLERLWAVLMSLKPPFECLKSVVLKRYKKYRISEPSKSSFHQL